MEAWKSNLESVIQKWEKRGPPAHIFEKKPGENFKSVPNIRQNGTSRSTRKRPKPANKYRQDRLKEREYWASLEVHQTPRKFKLISPVIKPPRAPYQMYQCNNCQKIQRSSSLLRKDSSPLSLFNVIDINQYSRKKSIICLFAQDMEFVFSRHMYKYPKAHLPTHDIKCVEDVTSLEEKPDEQTSQKALQSEILPKCKKLVSYISNSLTRITSWFLLKFLRHHFSSVCCQRQDIVVLQETAKKNIPFVYLPACNSLLDFFVIYFTLFCNNIRLPFTFIHDNTCSSRLSRFLLRRLGVTFVGECENKGISSAENAQLKTYIEQLLRSKQSLQINLANRSTSTSGDQNVVSKTVQNMTRSVIEGIIDDVFIVSVNVTYEKEFAGLSADYWNILNLLWQGRKSKFNGMIHIRFSYPNSLKDFCDREPKFPAQDWSNLKDPSNCVRSSHSSLSVEKVTENLLNHAISDCHAIGVINCTSMLCLLLTTKHKDEVSVEDLEITFEWLTREISNSNRFIGFFGATADVVSYGLELLETQHLIQLKRVDLPNSKTSRTVSVVQDCDKISRLFQYAHQVALVFVLKSIVATSIIGIVGGKTLFQIGQFVDDELSRNEILSLSKHLCHIFQSQYDIFPPCTDILMSVSDVLDSFIASGVLSISKNFHLNQPKKRAFDFEVDDYDDGYDTWNNRDSDIQYELSTSEEHRDWILFLHSLFAPALEKIWFMAACLSENFYKEELTEHDFVSSVNRRFGERVSKGHTFGVSGTYVHCFQRFVNILLVFGLLEESKDGESCRKLKAPLNIEQDDKYIDFMRKLESWL